MAVGLQVTGGSDCLTWDGGAQQSIINRYSCMMGWAYRTNGGTVNCYAASKENGGAIFSDTALVAKAYWRIDNGNRTVSGPTISINQWYHWATWFDHGANQIKLRLWDANAKTATTYSQNYTPTTWSLETSTAYMNLFCQTQALDGDMYGIVAGVKVWAPPGTSTQLSEAQIDLERTILWPGHLIEYCTFWCPVWSEVAAGSQPQYGTAVDKIATAQGSFSAPTSQPPGVMQVPPPLIPRPAARLRM